MSNKLFYGAHAHARAHNTMYSKQRFQRYHICPDRTSGSACIDNKLPYAAHTHARAHIIMYSQKHFQDITFLQIGPVVQPVHKIRTHSVCTRTRVRTTASAPQDLSNDTSFVPIGPVVQPVHRCAHLHGGRACVCALRHICALLQEMTYFSFPFQ